MYTFHVLLDVDGGNKDEHDDDIAFHFAKLCSDRRERAVGREREGGCLRLKFPKGADLDDNLTFVRERVYRGRCLPS